MKIDWFTAIAQILNFMILVMLLKKFLYRPVLKAIHEREELVTRQLQEAGNLKNEADNISNEYHSRIEALDKNRSALLEKTAAEAEEEREKLLEKTKKEVDTLRDSLYKNLKEEQKNLQEDISAAIQNEVMSVTRKVISDLADEKLENMIAHSFHKKLISLNEDEKRKFTEVMGLPGSEVNVITSFPLSPELTEETIRVIKLFSATAEVYFRNSTEQIAGIMLECSGFRISWNIQDYLEGIEKRIAELALENGQSENSNSK